MNGKLRSLTLAALAAVFAVAVGYCPPPMAAKTPGVDMPLRIAISDRVIYGVNRNDAAVAISLWVDELSKMLDIKVAAQSTWLMPSDQLQAAIKAGSLDLFCVTLFEYRRVQAYIDAARILTDGGDELIILVRQDAGIEKLPALAGKSLIVLESPYTELAEPWLAVTLHKEGLPAPPKLLGRISRTTRVAQVVLPVFFGQADACLAPRRAVNTMFELNPQLAKKLKVLVASPKFISAFLASHKDYPASLRNPMYQRLSQARYSPSAKQVFTLFQTFGFSVLDGESIRNGVEMIESYERLVPGKEASSR